MRTITRRWYLSAAAVAILAATPAPTTSCEGAGGGAPAAPQVPGLSCDLRQSKPPWIYKSRSNPGDVEIRASVWVWCKTPPQSHNLEAWLERDVTDGGAWMIPAKGYDSARSTRIPTIAGFELTTGFAGCISGKWRIRAKAAGFSGGVKYDFVLPMGESTVVKLTCPGPGR